ncbi:MAG TPA: response regulator transcription factor [Longimicrobiales bacterium]
MSSTPAGVARGLTLLLVDDNAQMRALIRSLIQDVAPVIHECDDGPSAVEAYPRIRPDWVLMDIELRGMDGIAATRAIRLLDSAARVVMVTGHGSDQYRRAASDAGASAFVLKEDLLGLPVLLEALLHPAPDQRAT